MLLARKRKHGGGDSHRPTDGAPRKRRSGRPLKHSRELAPPRSVTREKARKIHQQLQVDDDEADERARKRSRTLSAFERLPNEIIQHIFFDSLETNLALTSRTLNEDLTSEAVFRSLILLAFFPSQYWGDEWVEKNVFLPAQYRHLDDMERLELQRAIMSFRWCSLTRISRCLPILSRLVLRIQVRKEPSEPPPPSLSKLQHENLPVPSLPDPDDDEALREHYSALKTSSLYEAIRSRWGGSLAEQTGPDGTLPFILRPKLAWMGHLSKKYGEFRPVIGSMAIPDKLLRGAPWTEDRLALLQLLRQGFRFTPGVVYKRPGSIVSVSATALFDGMASAIEEQHRHALLCLLDLYCGIINHPCWDHTGRFSILPGMDIVRLQIDAHGRKAAGLWLLPSRLFHMAAEIGESSASFLALLIRASLTSIPKDDEVLTAWALRQVASGAGSKLGAWLLKYMEAPDHTRYSNLFVDGSRGRFIPDAPDGISTQDSFADELGLLDHWTVSRFFGTDDDAAPS